MKHRQFDGEHTGRDKDSLLARFSEGINNQAHLVDLELALDLVLDIPKQDEHRINAIDAALILKSLRVDAYTLIAALLGDPRLRSTPAEFIQKSFNGTVFNIVKHVNWLNTFNECVDEDLSLPKDAETLRRMLLATVDDIRAVLIKLAFRVQRLRNLPNEGSAIRRCIARETLDVYTPLANRLGIAQLKWELEDLAFRHLEPETYKQLAKSMESKRVDREDYIASFAEKLQNEVKKTGIEAEISGRAKHLYSSWKKMNRKQLNAVKDLADLLAVRVIVKDIPQCYMVLGMAHNLWKHIPHEFDDYIASPKSNGYQSIHTAVFGPNGHIVEIQIRTAEMQEFAENGVAAHWRYKEGSNQDLAMEQTIGQLRKMLENLDDNEALLEDFQAESFGDRVYVMTPKGDVVELIKGATPLDFAYSIHTQLGHRCVGARVNGQYVPLTYTLQSGEKVEVITSEMDNPRREWLDSYLDFLKTSSARAKVRSWFNKQAKELHIPQGREILENELHLLDLEQINEQQLAKQFNYADYDSFLAALGRADISPMKLADALNKPEVAGKFITAGIPNEQHADSVPLSIIGAGQLPVVIAECCAPEKGDKIVGYVTPQFDVLVHKQDCPNLLSLSSREKLKLIEVAWGREHGINEVHIHIEAFDRQRLLQDITGVLTGAAVNVLEANTRTNKSDQSVIMDLKVEVADTGQLTRVLEKINKLPNIFEARRIK